MKKAVIFTGVVLVILCLFFSGKYFLKSKKVEYTFDRPAQEEPVKEEVERPDSTKRPVSWGFQEAKERKIDTVVIHTSYDAIGPAPYDVDGLIEEYKSYKVAPHYLVDRNGAIYQLVEEKNIAYHAGKSQVSDGRQNVNDFSVGIELMNMKVGQITDEQYNALNELLKDIKSRYDIKYVLGHDQIAPDRKDDPWNFNWDKIDE